MNARQTASRIACLPASISDSVTIIGSQLGIADGYTQHADALVAAQRAQQAVAQHASAPPKLRA